MNNNKRIISEVIAMLYVLLWAYAGLSKLLDYGNFVIQLGKSPLIGGLAGWIAVGIPLVELMLALLLLFERTKRGAMYASLSLMMVFTAYLVIILNFSYYIPCACGGIISRSLGWKAHVIFNLFFILLPIVALAHPFKQRTNLQNLTAQ